MRVALRWAQDRLSVDLELKVPAPLFLKLAKSVGSRVVESIIQVESVAIELSSNSLFRFTIFPRFWLRPSIIKTVDDYSIALEEKN